MMQKPVVGITMGDPASIGPEIAVKALLNEKVYAICRPLLVGDAAVFQHIIYHLNIQATVQPVQNVHEAKFQFGVLDVFDLKNVAIDKLVFGEISAMAGNASFEAVKKVIDLAMAGEIDATVTGPINKKSINEAGHYFSGHTEIYAHYTGTGKYAMLLVEDYLKVIHVSTHVSLRQACDLVKKERILEVVDLLQNGLEQLGEPNLKIGIAGLNPHAGDSGLFGTEDDAEIRP
ncbi:MAG: 4-hydroxythreonine-4-phosphate dehydrogenase PdxA, partial [Flavisolibacter sp.]|nr:4-hydroxythreonine-4-phosphate dehydrogenase PdxA [Flavisolibacter sp.]